MKYLFPLILSILFTQTSYSNSFQYSAPVIDTIHLEKKEIKKNMTHISCSVYDFYISKRDFKKLCKPFKNKDFKKLNDKYILKESEENSYLSKVLIQALHSGLKKNMFIVTDKNNHIISNLYITTQEYNVSTNLYFRYRFYNFESEEMTFEYSYWKGLLNVIPLGS